MSQLATKAKPRWKVANKEHFNELARQDEDRYNIEHARYEQETVTSSSASLVSSTPSANLPTGSQTPGQVQNQFWPLVAPQNAIELTAKFARQDFWEYLSNHRTIRTNMDGGQKEVWKLHQEKPDRERWVSWVKGYENRLPFGALMTLQDGHWIEGCLLDAFLQKICAGQKAINYFTHAQIWDYSQTYKIACDWKLANTRLILAPLYVHQCHWTLALFNLSEYELTAEVMDSNTKNRLTELDKRWGVGAILNMIHYIAIKQGQPVYSKSKWTVNIMPPVPQQSTNDDCGIFSMILAMKIVEDPDSRNFDSFSQPNIPYYRRLICQMFIPDL